ncbi:hypothetical protein O9992_07275 [Vibrio lentus]|nr:hypothetical protein [Vibrio lentus]
MYVISVVLTLSLFDGRGNTAWAFASKSSFRKSDYDKVDRVRGLDITITTSAGSDEEGRALLAAFNCSVSKGRVTVMTKQSMKAREAKHVQN